MTAGGGLQELVVQVSRRGHDRVDPRNRRPLLSHRVDMINPLHDAGGDCLCVVCLVEAENEVPEEWQGKDNA